MRNLKKYVKAFIKDENGFELLQVAIVVLIVAALAVIVWQIAANAGGKLQEAENAIDAIDITLPQQ